MSAFGFVRRVLDRDLAQVEFLPVDLLDHGLGVGHPAVLQEPARRLRDSATHQDHDQTQNGTGREEQSPVIVAAGDADDERADHVRGNRARRPRDSRHPDHGAALLGGRELGEQRGGDGVVGTDGRADDEAQDDELPRQLDEHRQPARDDQHHQVEGVHLLPADPVGEEAEHGGAEEDTDQRGGTDQPCLGCRRVKLLGHPEQGHADDAHDVPVQEWSATARDQELGVEPAFGGSVHHVEGTHVVSTT